MFHSQDSFADIVADSCEWRCHDSTDSRVTDSQVIKERDVSLETFQIYDGPLCENSCYKIVDVVS